MMFRKNCFTLGLSVFLLTMMVDRPAVAAGIQSCYDMLRIQKPSMPPKAELVVMVDQTTLLDDHLKAQVIENVQRNIEGGNAFSIIVFSAFINNKYTEQVASGMLDYPMSQALRDDTGKATLRKFDTCINEQRVYANKLVAKALTEGFARPSEKIERSDILAAFADVSKGTVKPSPAASKIVFLVSDMLENSSVSSFYANNGIRLIDANAEMKKVEGANLLADFDGGRVYVVGAGVIPVDPKNHKAASYRDPKTMQALKSFWQTYFRKSNAKLVEFGEPALLGQVE